MPLVIYNEETGDYLESFDGFYKYKMTTWENCANKYGDDKRERETARQHLALLKKLLGTDKLLLIKVK